MAESNFVDYVKIYCRSGKGGRGSTHFRREKYIPKGGPDGGDGGRGGDIYVRANENYWTLLHLRYQRHVIATNGGNGSGKRSSGADGQDQIIEVPVGTVIYDAETGEFIMDLSRDGQQELLLKGGRGGKGNTFFKTSTNQAPRYAQPGEPARERTVILQLKMLADVGLVGLPNAGKSTLLSVLTAAKPKIANYPFTTLEPNLGMVRYREDRSFVMADIPGIIEGADTERIADEYRLLLGELTKYNAELLEKRKVLAITKCDLIDEEIQGWIREELQNELPEHLPLIFISAAAHQGLSELKDLLWHELNRETKHRAESIIQQAIDVTSLTWDDDEEPLPPLDEDDEPWDEEEDGDLELDWDDLEPSSPEDLE